LGRSKKSSSRERDRQAGQPSNEHDEGQLATRLGWLLRHPHPILTGPALASGRQDPDVGHEVVGIEVAREDRPDLAPRIDHVHKSGVANQLR